MKGFSFIRLYVVIIVALGLVAWHNNTHILPVNIIAWLILAFLGYRYVMGMMWIESSDSEEDSP